MDHAKKETFHRNYSKILRAIAKGMGLPTGSYTVRSNKAGPDILGEVTLHGERIYLQVGGSLCEPDRPDVMYRSCKGQKDYTGGMNRWDITARMLVEDQPEAILLLQEAAGML